MSVSLAQSSGPLTCAVKFSPDGAAALHREATALRLIEQAELPGPRLLGEPIDLLDGTGAMALSIVEGEPLPWMGVIEVAVADQTCRLMSQALDQLHGYTPAMQATDEQGLLPRRTLRNELSEVASSPWTQTPIHQAAADAVAKHLDVEELPLVFTNGDYNPLNVLFTPSGELAWIDFEHAVFEDPLIGLAKFWFWSDDRGWALARQSGLVERHLFRHGITPQTFAVRVALRGLQHLARCDPQHEHPKTLLNEIERATAML